MGAPFWGRKGRVKEVKPNCESTHASFRLMGASLNPKIITKILRIQPSMSHRKGDAYKVRLGRGDGYRTLFFREGLWVLDTEEKLKSSNLERHLAFLVDRLESHSTFLNSTRFRKDVYCVWVSRYGHGGPDLSSSILARLGRLGIGLSFDFYYSGSILMNYLSPPEGGSHKVGSHNSS